jgi:hypothetical protein
MGSDTLTVGREATARVHRVGFDEENLLVYAGAKTMTLVAGIVMGVDRIDDVDALRAADEKASGFRCGVGRGRGAHRLSVEFLNCLYDPGGASSGEVGLGRRSSAARDFVGDPEGRAVYPFHRPASPNLGGPAN